MEKMSMDEKQAEMDQAEREFANEVMEENKELLENLTQTMGGYAQQGRSDKLYLLVKAVNTIMQMAQARMKQTLGIDPGKMNWWQGLPGAGKIIRDQSFVTGWLGE